MAVYNLSNRRTSFYTATDTPELTSYRSADNGSRSFHSHTFGAPHFHGSLSLFSPEQPETLGSPIGEECLCFSTILFLIGYPIPSGHNDGPPPQTPLSRRTWVPRQRSGLPPLVHVCDCRDGSSRSGLNCLNPQISSPLSVRFLFLQDGDPFPCIPPQMNGAADPLSFNSFRRHLPQRLWSTVRSFFFSRFEGPDGGYRDWSHLPESIRSSPPPSHSLDFPFDHR